MFETDNKIAIYGSNGEILTSPMPDHELDSEENRRLHTVLVGHLMREMDRQSANREQMVLDEAFYDHKQWSPTDEAFLYERGQKALTFNVIHMTINWILGAQRRQRSQYRILARRKEGVPQAELKTQFMKYLNDVNETHFEVSDAYAETVKAGISFMETGLSYNTDGEDIHENYTSWRDLLWDSACKRRDLNDGRYMFRPRWTDLDRSQKMFPDRMGILEMSSERNIGESGLYDGLGDFASDIHEASFFNNSLGVADYGQDIAPYNYNAVDSAIGPFGYSRRPRVRLVEAWFRTYEEGEFIRGGQYNGELYDRSSLGQRIDLMHEVASIDTRPAEMMKVAIFCRAGLLYLGPSPYRHNRFPFTPIWAYRDADTLLPYGLIRGLRNPQEDINKRASKLLHIMNTKRTLIEEGSVDDIEELREEVARPDAIIQYKSGRQKPDISSDLADAKQNWDFMGFTRAMIEEFGGVNKDNMGVSSSAQKSGRAIIAHQEQGSLSIQTLTDNLSRGYREHGRKVLSNMEQFVTEERSIRVTGERGAEYTDINKAQDMSDSVTSTKADFVVSEDQFSDTMRQQAVQMLFDLLSKLSPTNPELVTQLLDLLVESMDIPNYTVIVQRIRDITGVDDPDKDPNTPPTPEEQRKMAEEERQAQLAQRMQESEVALAESKASVEGAKADKLYADIKNAFTSMTKEQMEVMYVAIQAAKLLAEMPSAGPAADTLVLEADKRAAERGGGM